MVLVCLLQSHLHSIPAKSDFTIFQLEITCGSYQDVRVADIIRRLRLEFKNSEIGVICVGGSYNYKEMATSLAGFGIQTTTDLDNADAVIVSLPRIIRGHERRAVIVCIPSGKMTSDKWGKAINSYIALSRARDKLVVIESEG